MHIILYLAGGFMMVFGLSLLVVREPITGLIFIGLLVLAVVVAAALVRADDQGPSNTSTGPEEN